MTCPVCGTKVAVTNTRQVNGERVRVRQCRKKHVILTKEVVTEILKKPPRKRPIGRPKGQNKGEALKKLHDKRIEARAKKILESKDSPKWLKDIFRKIQ